MPKKEETYPAIKVVFKPDGPDVTLTYWEKINARMVEKAVREVNKARKIYRKTSLREIRLKEAKNAGRPERQEGAGSTEDSSTDA